MSKAAGTEKRARTGLKSVDGGSGGGSNLAEKKERKPRGEGKPRVGKDFNAQLRALADSHRAKLGTLVALESKLETQRATATAKIDRKLATVRAQREAAEAPLRDVEAILAARPPLPGLAEPANDVNNQPMASEPELDAVNQ